MQKYLNYIIAFLFGIYTGILILDVIVVKRNNTGIPQIKSQITQTPDHKELNLENVEYWINYFEIRHPEIVLAQSIQECGWNYTSYKAENMNNIFGFQTSDSSVLSFGHWIGCIIYYKKWQETYYEGGDYFIFLKEYKYAEDSLYCLKLAEIVQMLEAN